ncbi:MAG TPA: hypothetical protein VMY05_07130 [Acidobacteriota bacterium]|nr:hypothetical protein [Acidobacteriota bacterium]
MRTFLVLFAIVLLTTALPTGAEEAQSPDTNSYTVPLGEGITLEMTVAKFKAGEHKLTGYQEPGRSYASLIDGKPVFGTDGELPSNQLIKATVIIEVDTISLDVSCMYNPFFGEPDPRFFKIVRRSGFVIWGYFSDGAGSYEAEWLIVKNSSVRVRLEWGEC